VNRPRICSSRACGQGDYWSATNALYAGAAASPDATGNAKAIREFNAHVKADDGVESVLLPVADGLLLARKRSDHE